MVLLLVSSSLAVVTSAPQAAAAGVRYLDEVFADTTKTADVTYDTVTNHDGNIIDVKMDIYQPTGDTETRRPAIVYIHGGYFAGGDKSEGARAAQMAAKRGYVAVSINYRIWPGAASDLGKLAWGIQKAQWDTQSAVRYLRRNADSLGINPVAIFAMGYSAGAVTALNVNYRGHEPGDGANQNYASDVAGAVSLAGFANEVTPVAPPVMMFHGDQDPVVNYAWGLKTCNEATAIGDSCVMHTYPGATHNLSPYFDDIYPKIWAFLFGLLPPLLDLPAPLAGYHPLSPVRLLDTRTGLGTTTRSGGAGLMPHPPPARRLASPVLGGDSIDVEVAGHGGVPTSGVSAVILNVTAVGATVATHVTVWPGGTPMPGTSNLNVVGGQTVANLVTTGVGSTGTVEIANHQGELDLLADVVGYYDDGTGPGDLFTAIAPSRVLDTRDGTGGHDGPLLAGDPHDFAVAGTVGVPTDSTAAVLNLTAVNGSSASHLTAWPTGEQMPGVSNINFKPGTTVANLAAVKLGTGGKVSLANNAGGVYTLADVTGYYRGTGNRFVAVPPTRALDTRLGIGAPPVQVPGGNSIVLTVKGAPGLPPDGIAGVVINVTVVGATTPTHVSVYPTGIPQPNASTVNVAAGRTVPNLAMIGVGPGGSIALYNNAGSVHLVGDIVGYFT